MKSGLAISTAGPPALAGCRSLSRSRPVVSSRKATASPSVLPSTTVCGKAASGKAPTGTAPYGNAANGRRLSSPSGETNSSRTPASSRCNGASTSRLTAANFRGACNWRLGSALAATASATAASIGAASPSPMARIVPSGRSSRAR